MPKMKPEPRFQAETAKRKSHKQIQAECPHTVLQMDVQEGRMRCTRCDRPFSDHEYRAWRAEA